MFVCFSFHPIWFFFVSNFCHSCISLAKSFKKKLFNIVISNPVYNLVYGIFTIIKTIVGNVNSLIVVFLRKYICFHYIFIFLF